MKKVANEPAFPYEQKQQKADDVYKQYPGISMRDFFAANAVNVAAEMVARGCGNYAAHIASSAYEIADAMLAERAK